MLPQIPVVRIADAQKIPLPTYADGVGTSMILRSAEAKSVKIAPRRYEIFTTGLAIALPIGMEAQIRSLKESTENGITVLNAPVTIDASDRAEIKICIYNASQESVIIKPNDPIALMVFALALRVKWNDQTPSVIEKIQKKKIENEQQIEADSERRKQAEAIVANMLVQNTFNQQNETLTEEETTTENFSNLEEKNSQVISNEIITETEIITNEKALEKENIVILEHNESLAENLSKEDVNLNIINSNIDTYSNSEGNIDHPIILTESLDTKQQESTQASQIEEQISNNQIETNIATEHLLIDEPIAPPAILEEFEKIESNFKINQTEEEV